MFQPNTQKYLGIGVQFRAAHALARVLQGFAQSN
jgi:hypothetical protein